MSDSFPSLYALFLIATHVGCAVMLFGGLSAAQRCAWGFLVVQAVATGLLVRAAYPGYAAAPALWWPGGLEQLVDSLEGIAWAIGLSAWGLAGERARRKERRAPKRASENQEQLNSSD